MPRCSTAATPSTWRPADFDIQLADDGTTWQNAAHVQPSVLARLAVPRQHSGRYVRVRLRGTGMLSLAEAQVFAP